MRRHTGRHLFYQQHLLPAVASVMDLRAISEHRRVDCVLFEGPQRWIAVEIENDPSTAIRNEIPALAGDAAPLVILILTLRWHHSYIATPQRRRWLRPLEVAIRRKSAHAGLAVA